MSIHPLSDYELLPIYVRVADDLRAKLEAGQFPAGTFLPGELELSQAYGLSRGTVRKALSILAGEGRISRQPGRGTLVLPVPRPVRRQVAVVWSIIRAIGTDMLAGLESAISQAGYDLLFSTSEHQPDKEAEILRRLLHHPKIDGIVLYATGATQNDPLVEQIIADGIPLVLIDRFVPALRERVSWVTSDNAQGAYEITRHLVQLGHRRIAFVLWTPDDEHINTLTERRAGYLRALEEAGLGALVLSVCGAQSWQLGSAGFIERFCAFWNAHRPTAAFFNSDAAALRAYPLIEQRGIRIPDDLSIAGFDGLRLPYGVNPYDFTTAVQDFTQMGVKTGEALLDMIQDPARAPLHIRVPVTLYIGKTISPPVQASAVNQYVSGGAYSPKNGL